MVPGRAHDAVLGTGQAPVVGLSWKAGSSGADQARQGGVLVQWAVDGHEVQDSQD